MLLSLLMIKTMEIRKTGDGDGGEGGDSLSVKASKPQYCNVLSNLFIRRSFAAAIVIPFR